MSATGQVAGKTFAPEPGRMRTTLEALLDVVLCLIAPVAGFVFFASFFAEPGITPRALFVTRIALGLVTGTAAVVLVVRIAKRLFFSELRLLADRIEHTGVWTTTISVSEIASVTLSCPDLRTPAGVEITGKNGRKIAIANAAWPIERLALTLRRTVAPVVARRLARRLAGGEAIELREPRAWRRHGYAVVGALGLVWGALKLLDLALVPWLIATGRVHEPAVVGGMIGGVVAGLFLGPLALREGWRMIRRYVSARRGGLVVTSSGLRGSLAEEERPWSAVTGARVDGRGIVLTIDGSRTLRLSISAESYLAVLELLPRLLPSAVRWDCAPAQVAALDACVALPARVAARRPAVVKVARPVARAA